jgi:hypothetical protein
MDIKLYKDDWRIIKQVVAQNDGIRYDTVLAHSLDASLVWHVATFASGEESINSWLNTYKIRNIEMALKMFNLEAQIYDKTRPEMTFLELCNLFKLVNKGAELFSVSKL